MKKLFINKKRRQKKTKMHDVFFRPHEQVLFLKKRTWKDRLSLKKWGIFFKMRYVAYSFIIVLAIVGISLYSVRLGAQVAVFHPTSCLGGWTHSEYAEGEPNVKADGLPDDFTENNSAVLNNSVSQIFCGGWKGELPEDTEPKRYVLKLSWSAEGRQQENVATTTIIIDQGNNIASTSEQILDAPSDKAVEATLILDEATPTEEETQTGTTPTEPAPEPAAPVESAPAEAAPPSVPENSAPVSFWRHIFETAFAQEVTIDSNLATSTTEEFEEFLEVLYTLDGINWTRLGVFQGSNVRNAEFEIPRDAINPSDISKLQVSIKSKATVNAEPVIYLDGMSLDVEYEKIVVNEPDELENIGDLPRESVDAEGFLRHSRKISEQTNQLNLI
jgi:hypothetical protein